MSFNSVLIIDDDPTQVAILHAYFSSLQAKSIKGTTDAREALRFIDTHKKDIDLIVCDLQMPDMDGIEFLRHLSKTKYDQRLAIISGVKTDLLQHASRLAKMHSLHFIGQIAKPVTKSALDAVFLKNVTNSVMLDNNQKYYITQSDYAAALQKNEIEPYYQPKIDVKSGKIVGAEALVRWNKPGFGFISPETLIKFAESNGRIEELTFYLFDKSIKAISEFLKVDDKQVFATNLSPIMAKNLSLPDQLLSRIRVNNLKPENFSFEVTENDILHLDVTTLEVLSRLRILSFDVAIDDFGTGSSNIQTLRDFPYSELKIDRSFVSNSPGNIFSQETVRAAVSLSSERGMRTVAEGVENTQTFDFIKSQGIDEVQGHLFSKALSKDDYLQFIEQHKNGIDLTTLLNAA